MEMDEMGETVSSVMIVTCIEEFPVSNLVWDIGYPEAFWGFLPSTYWSTTL
jgi:hypothetical protein